jgi:hypothetical protein
MSTDWDKIAAIEKAVKEKYGEKAIDNPKANWNEEKEKDYIEQVKQQAKIISEKSENQETIEENGFLLKKKLFTTKTSRVCPVTECKRYSFSLKDDVYVNKFDCCYECYIKYVEGREDLWQKRKKVMTNGSDQT